MSRSDVATYPRDRTVKWAFFLTALGMFAVTIALVLFDEAREAAGLPEPVRVRPGRTPQASAVILGPGVLALGVLLCIRSVILRIDRQGLTLMGRRRRDPGQTVPFADLAAVRIRRGPRRIGARRAEQLEFTSRSGVAYSLSLMRAAVPADWLERRLAGPAGEHGFTVETIDAHPNPPADAEVQSIWWMLGYGLLTVFVAVVGVLVITEPGPYVGAGPRLLAAAGLALGLTIVAFAIINGTRMSLRARRARR